MRLAAQLYKTLQRQGSFIRLYGHGDGIFVHYMQYAKRIAPTRPEL